MWNAVGHIHVVKSWTAAPRIEFADAQAAGESQWGVGGGRSSCNIKNVFFDVRKR